jgi:glycosyltransferase involved in cell wall biosynthesis
LVFRGKYKLILHDHYGDIEINTSVPLKLRLAFKPVFYIGVSQRLTEWAIKNMQPKKAFLLRNTVIPQPGVSYNGCDSIRVLMIANIRPTKNIEFAIELCSKLNMCLDIYGNVGDQQYYSYLASKIAGNPSIRIIEGVTSFDALYNNYSLAIHTALSETGPLVLLEYMAYGIPFVSYKTGEVAQVVASQLPLHFVDSFDIKIWERHICTIQQEKDLPSKLKTLFGEHFGADNYLKQCLQIYQDVSC